MHPTASVDQLAVAHAVGKCRLAQYLVACPACGRAAAAHLDESSLQPVLVRLVCPTSCVVDPAAVLALFSGTRHRMSA